MGYTHYWTDYGQGDELPADAVTLIRRITDEAHRQSLIQREYDDSRPPIVTAQEINFNGVGELGHETFHFQPSLPDRFCFCKTARKPYDMIVMRVLLLLGYYRPGLEIRSDGDFHGEWQPALDWFNEQVGYVYIEERLGFDRLIDYGWIPFENS